MLLGLAVPAVPDYQAGLDAYAAGDYQVALREWLEVAEGPPTAVSPGAFIESHYAIAMLHWQGQGVPRDYFKAHEWLLRAARLNHAGAQAKLGYLYAQGIVVEKSHEQAFEWFQKAARQGEVDGQYNLGVFYLKGWGTDQDVTMGKQYLAAAAAQGDEAAEQALQRLLAASGADEAPVGAASAANANQPKNLVAGTVQDHIAAKAAPTAAPAKPAGGKVLLGPDWILAQEPEHYTIQVVAVRDRARLEQLVEGFDDMVPFAVYRARRNTRPLYVLVQGNYPDVETARAARDAFPRRLQKRDQLWIRRFRMVQRRVEH